MNKTASAIYTYLQVAGQATISDVLDYLWQLGFDPYENGREIVRQIFDGGCICFVYDSQEMVELRGGYK